MANLVYDRLHRIAAGQMFTERADHTLQPTVLVHEAYLQLINQSSIEWRDRAHFFAVAASMMRNILIDYARSRTAAKRGGHRRKMHLDEVVLLTCVQWDQMLAVDEAMTRLAERDPRMSRIVEMRFFGGMTEEEVADVEGVSVRTVKRDWKVAKGWLKGELAPVV